VCAPQDLNLALNEVTEAGADALAAFLQGRTALQRLVLRENELGNEGAVALAGALQVGRLPAGLAAWLLRLVIWACMIGASQQLRTQSSALVVSMDIAASQGLTPLCTPAEYVSCCAQSRLSGMMLPQSLAGLRELDLCGNQIRGSGALAVVQAIAQLPHLESLQLDENEISDHAVAAIKVRDAAML
jgi:Ran GTPase-activating protein (RanGAP) involved in mRNA processing and transport